MIPSDNCVLYADDDIDDRELMSETFEDYPEFKLKLFESGQAILDYLQQASPDDLCFIILDNNMPSVTGYEVLQQIRAMEQYHHIPVVVYTTGTLDSFKAKVAELNAKLVIKPTSISGIKEAVKHIVSICTDRSV